MCVKNLGRGAHGKADRECLCDSKDLTSSCENCKGPCVVVKYSDEDTSKEGHACKVISDAVKGTPYENNFLKFVSYDPIVADRYSDGEIKTVIKNSKLVTEDLGPGAVDAEKFIAKLGVLTKFTLQCYFVQIFAALDFAFEKAGFLHMDLKPANTVILERATVTPYMDLGGKMRYWRSPFLVVIIDYGEAALVDPRAERDHEVEKPSIRMASAYFPLKSEHYDRMWRDEWNGFCYTRAFDAFRLIYDLLTRVKSLNMDSDASAQLTSIWEESFKKWIPAGFTKNSTVKMYAMMSGRICEEAPEMTFMSLLNKTSTFRTDAMPKLPGSPKAKLSRSISRSKASRSRSISRRSRGRFSRSRRLDELSLSRPPKLAFSSALSAGRRK